MGGSVAGECWRELKVSIRLPVLSQAAGRWPSWVTQMRGGLFNVKPSLSEKATDHLPLSGPTNTVDAGQISSFPAVFQPPASKANRKGDWITLPGGRWRVCIRRGAEYAPRGLESPSDASRLLQCLAPACLHCVCVDPIPATIAIITAWGRASLFLRL